MKKLCLIGALTGTSLCAISQTSLDHLLFEKCNSYRSSEGLKKWVWSGEAFEPAEHHTDYQVKTETIGHRENSKTPNFTHLLKRFDFHPFPWSSRCDI